MQVANVMMDSIDFYKTDQTKSTCYFMDWIRPHVILCTCSLEDQNNFVQALQNFIQALQNFVCMLYMYVL